MIYTYEEMKRWTTKVAFYVPSKDFQSKTFFTSKNEIKTGTMTTKEANKAIWLHSLSDSDATSRLSVYYKCRFTENSK